MRLPFREFHLFQFLDLFNNSPYPMDRAISLYFKEHQSLGSKDRAWISDTAYHLLRHHLLLEHLACSSWEDKLKILLNLPSIHHLPPHIQVSFPQPFFDRIVKAYGEKQALEICHLSNQRAPATIRVNTLKISRKALLEKLAPRFSVVPCPVSKTGITFLEKTHFFSLPEFKEGLFEVQDEASQLICELIVLTPGDSVLDYCAGSGGKALAIGAKMRGRGQLYLHDIRPFALQEAKKRLKRASIQNFQIQAPLKDAFKKKMDWVLVDAPCSGSGTLRRNPDMKGRFSEEGLFELVGKQRLIFERALSFVKEGGHIVFATCSLLSEENEAQVAHFLKTYPLEVASSFKSLPVEGGMDGFFATCFKKLKG